MDAIFVAADLIGPEVYRKVHKLDSSGQEVIAPAITANSIECTGNAMAISILDTDEQFVSHSGEALRRIYMYLFTSICFVYFFYNV